MPRSLIALILMLLMPGMLLGEVFDLEADHVEKTQDTVEARGNVVVQTQDMHLTCSYLVYDSASGDLWATGDCRLQDAKSEIQASTVQYNRVRQDAHIENGSILVYAEPMRITGTSLTRYGNDLYIGEDLTYTSCLGETPAWSIRARSLEIPLEGYGRAKDARIQVRDVPLAYIPYLLFPAKLKRQSGLLFPSIASSSDTGFRFGLPVYLTLGRSADMTVTPTYLSERGGLLAAELRYALDYQQRGNLYAEFLHDRQGGERYAGGVLAERPANRWYVKADQHGGDLIWDINLVSNHDYFRDIGPLYAPEQDAQWIGVQPSKTEEQISRLQWAKTYGAFSLGLSSQWKQDLTVRNDDLTLQELPRVMARMAQQTIPHTPLRLSAELNAAHIASQEWVRAVKDYGKVELSLPYSFAPYFTVRPYVQEIYRDTRFTERQDFERGVYAEHWQQRGITLATALYSPRFYQDWYHQVVPAITWTTQTRWGGNADPDDVSDPYPLLLPDDTWVKQDDIQCSLTNYIRDDTGRSVIDVALNRSYSRLTEEWGLFEVVARVNPNQWMALEHSQKFGPRPDPATGVSRGGFATQTHTTTLSLTDARGDMLWLGEEYDRIDTKLLYGRTLLNLGRGWGLLAEAKYDLIDKRFEFVRQGLSYDAQCWGIVLGYDVEPSDEETQRRTTVGLTVRLLGLGDVKTSHRMTNG